LKKSTSGVLVARNPQRTYTVRLGFLASCGLAGWSFLITPFAETKGSRLPGRNPDYKKMEP